MKNLSLRGVVTPLVTPLSATAELDLAGFHKLIEDLLAAGVSAVFPLGSSGEGPWLTIAEQQRAVRYVVELVDDRVPVLAGVLECSTSRVIEAITRAEDAGAAAVVVTTPYYFEVDEAAIERHFAAIAQHARIPVVLYNIPQMTGNTITPKLVSNLLVNHKICAIKDSAGDFEAFQQFLALRSKKSDFRVLQGAERQAAIALRAGADGVVPGLSNIVPHWFVEMCAANDSNEIHRLSKLQCQVNKLSDLHNHGYWLACLKHAASRRGYGSGVVAPPGMDLTQDARRAIDDLVSTRVAGK
ncbi:MAG: dihydrodipicolinate synthase family protein [Pseudomonadales bacterium]